MVVKVGVSSAVSRRIRRLSLKAYPNEFFGALIGGSTATSAKILDLWVPEDLTKYTSESHVRQPNHWSDESNHYALEHGMQVVGSVHSHPLDWPCLNSASPSEGDWEMSWSNICGICAVLKMDDGKLYTRLRFYGPAVAARVSTIK